MDREPPEQATRTIDVESLDPWERQTLDMYNAIQLVHKKATLDLPHGFDGKDVMDINKAVLENQFQLNPHLYGRLRKGNVRIVSTINGNVRESSVKPVDARELPYIFDNFSKNLSEKTGKISAYSPIAHVLDTASWTHIELIRIHPFVEGNGRTARCMVDLIFQRADLPFITDWGSKDREYIECVYETYDQKDPRIFKRFLAAKLKKSYRELEKVGAGVKEHVAEQVIEIDDYIDTLEI